MKTKRTYKDSLFRHIFKNKTRLSKLYKALSGNDVPPRDITINTLRGVFMNDVKNDISFRVRDRLVILLEYQSTWNPNMPTRFLWYVSRIYAREVTKEIIYKSELVKIPTPEFYVLYNGPKDIPYFQELRLSDAFMEPGDALELKAKCYNINYSTDNPLIGACYELRCYSIFVAKVREGVQNGETLFSAVKAAIRYCETHDLMAGYFVNNENEVFDMVSFKWDDKRAKEIAFEEGVEKGEARGIKNTTIKTVLSLLKKHYPLSTVTDATDLSPEEVEKIAKEHGLAF